MIALPGQFRSSSVVSTRSAGIRGTCDQLALAARNFNPDLASLTNSAVEPPINQRGTVVYHGPFAGLQLTGNSTVANGRDASLLPVHNPLRTISLFANCRK